MVKNVKFIGKKAIVSFEKVNGTLIYKGDIIKGFMLCGEDIDFKNAQARIIEDKVEVWCEEIDTPVGLRYGYTSYCECNLYNDSGLPVTPFSHIIV